MLSITQKTRGREKIMGSWMSVFLTQYQIKVTHIETSSFPQALYPPINMTHEDFKVCMPTCLCTFTVLGEGHPRLVCEAPENSSTNWKGSDCQLKWVFHIISKTCSYHVLISVQFLMKQRVWSQDPATPIIACPVLEIQQYIISCMCLTELTVGSVHVRSRLRHVGVHQQSHHGSTLRKGHGLQECVNTTQHDCSACMHACMGVGCMNACCMHDGAACSWAEQQQRCQVKSQQKLYIYI